MSERFYAGIGSRSTPGDVLGLMIALASRLGGEGWVLRSGRADGADYAFEHGAQSFGASLFVPWPGFGPRSHHIAHELFVRPSPWAMADAALHHPAWGSCSDAARKLHARNVHQLRGPLSDSPLSRFVVCWTSDGAITAAETSRATGGTGQAIRLAESYGVPVFNLALGAHRERVERFVAR